MTQGDPSASRRHLVAAAVTVLAHAALVALLLTLYLTSGAEDPTRTWPPVDSAEVLFGGEYVMVGDKPELAESSAEAAPEAPEAESAPSPEAPDMTNSGPAADPAPVVTTERPSPAKAEKKPAPEKTGPSKEELEAQARAKREEETRKAIAAKTRFDRSGSAGTGSGKAGSPDGNSSTGAASGTPGFNLRGRTLASWEEPAAAPMGTITVRVTVNRQGKVISATYYSGSGAAAASEAARRNCERAALKSQFSVLEDGEAKQTGFITYRFR